MRFILNVYCSTVSSRCSLTSSPSSLPVALIPPADSYLHAGRVRHVHVFSRSLGSGSAVPCSIPEPHSVPISWSGPSSALFIAATMAPRCHGTDASFGPLIIIIMHWIKSKLAAVLGAAHERAGDLDWLCALLSLEPAPTSRRLTAHPSLLDSILISSSKTSWLSVFKL